MSAQPLSPEQQQFLKLKSCKATKTTAEWRMFLRPICEQDAILDKRRSMLRWSSLGLILPALPIGFLSIASDFKIGTTAAAVMLCTGIILLIIAAIFGRADLRNVLRDSILPFLGLLEADAESAPLTLSIDLRGRLHKSKKKKKVGDTKFYEDHWCTGSVKLADKNLLSWDFADFTRDRKYTKRSASGKTKFKRKTKLRIVLSSSLRVDERYAFKASRKTIDGNQKAKKGEKGIVIKSRNVSKHVLSELDQEFVSTKMLLSIIAAPYSSLNRQNGENQ